MNEFNKDTWENDSYSVEYLPPDDIETIYDVPPDGPLDTDEPPHPHVDSYISEDIIENISVDSAELSTEQQEASTEAYLVLGESETDPLTYWRSMNTALWLIAFILLFWFCYERIKNGLRATRKLSK